MTMNGMLNINWNDIDAYSEEDITYFLFLEGKSIETLCKIRNLSKETIRKHIVDGKIKHGILAKSEDEKALFKTISMSGKLDKIEVLKNLGCENKERLVNFIRNNYANMKTKDKESAIWILGELGDTRVVGILMKGTVHKHVSVRRMAVSALGKIGDKSAEAALIRALEDTNPQVIMYAIKSLMKIQSDKPLNKIKNINDNTDKVYIKKVAEEYLRLFNK